MEKSVISNKRRLLCLATLGGLLSGCGFQLRGRANTATIFPFQTIYLNQPSSSPLGAGLRRQLAPYDGVTVVDTPQEAQIVLEVLSEARDKARLTLNSQGRVREYALTYTLTYRVTNGSSEVLLPPAQVAASRTLSFNENAALGKETEESFLYRDMQADLIQQILRRLSLLPPAG